MLTARLAADAVLVLHVAYVLFVVGGLVLTLIGGWARWGWVRNRWFRSLHLAAIVVVVVQSWLGVECPLTTLERWLRQAAGDRGYDGAFVAHWLERLLYIEAPPAFFVSLYTAFAALVLWTWIKLPPRWPPLQPRA